MADERQTAEDRLMVVVDKAIGYCDQSQDVHRAFVRQAALAWVVAEIEWVDSQLPSIVDGRAAIYQRLAELRERMS